jgi:hypothetical protein
VGDGSDLVTKKIEAYCTDKKILILLVLRPEILLQ